MEKLLPMSADQCVTDVSRPYREHAQQTVAADRGEDTASVER